MAQRNKEEERQQHLEDYILKCIGDSVLSWGDLVSGDAYDRLLRVLSADAKAVVKGLLPRAGIGLLSVAATKLAEHAAGAKRRKRA